MADIEAIQAETALAAKQTEKLRTAQSIVLVIVLGLIFLALYVGLYKSEGKFLASLRDTETSRGLITFLVAVTTVSIALVLAIYAMASNEGAALLKERFSYAKDVLSTLVGILGTVIGFYFGTTVNNQVESLVIAEPQFKGGQLITHITGGTPPYRYTIAPPGDDLTKLQTKTSKDGWILEQLPANANPVTLEATDSKDKKVSRVIKVTAEVRSAEQPGSTAGRPNTPAPSESTPGKPTTSPQSQSQPPAAPASAR